MFRATGHEKFMTEMTASPAGMSAEVELELIRAYKKSKDTRLVDKLVRAHAKLIHKEVNRQMKAWRRGGNPKGLLDEGDLFQEGCLGLIRSLERFDPDRGFRFTTYSMWWWRAYMGIHASRQQSIVWHADRRKSIPADLGFQMEAGVDEKGCVNMDALDFGAGPLNPEEACIQSEAVEAITDAIEALPAKQRDIVSWLLVDDTTMQEAGTELGVTRQRVEQIHKQAWGHIRYRLQDLTPPPDSE